MKTGFGMLLKAMGVDVDPVQIGEFIAQAQVAIPQFINGMAFHARELNERLARMERNQARIMTALNLEEEPQQLAVGRIDPAA